jgi:hypothetical protein
MSRVLWDVCLTVSTPNMPALDASGSVDRKAPSTGVTTLQRPPEPLS